ncbi:MAG TPA: sulfotransferase [Stellaceae bacterium]|nr:sulfotransferase [Stellaceae bacterium]
MARLPPLDRVAKAAMTQNHATGTPAIALENASRLLNAKPSLAAEQAEEILKAVPDQPGALLILGAAKRRLGELDASRSALEKLVRRQPAWADAQYEYGLTLAALGRPKPAQAALKRATELKPQLTDAWRALGDQFTLAGNPQAADAAYAQHIRSSTRNPALMEAASALCENRLAVAERLLKAYLKRFPTDVAAIRMLAELASRLGRYEDAEALLARCLELAPGFAAARHNYAFVLHRRNKPVEAIAELDRLLAEEPGDPNHRGLKAAASVQIGNYGEAIRIYEDLLRDYPAQSKGWMSYGHALKTEGRTQEGIAAYRRSIAEEPNLGEAYWSLANLKTFRFEPEDVAAMEAQLARAELGDDDRLHLHFALGKALEDVAEDEAAFRHYEEGNRIRRRQLEYDPDETTERVERVKRLFTESFLAARDGWGSPAPDPVFIVGLPRSGSTLIEQILASHSAVEGTMELPDMPAIAKELGGRHKRKDPSLYPEILADLPAERLAGLGEEYLRRTRVQRKTGRPHFIDKLPNNFLHVGMILLILPNARIIDARRHPLATCFSGFKQHFARGQAFSYGLTDIGRYYADYVELMAHFDRVARGRIHRVHYESMVGDTEGEIRRLLDYCGLPFEAGCLRFWENERSVRTASAEQVRRPIFSDGLDQWRRFEPWLAPLKQALGPILEGYPESHSATQPLAEGNISATNGVSRM